MRKKEGDTLVEVSIAIGIFSMVAIAAVAVMSGSASSAQTALETTLAREEIDIQAEALRFIHSAYLSETGSNNNQKIYSDLWDEITKNAIKVEDSSELTYAPSTCSDSPHEKAFIINPRLLSSDNPKNAYINNSSIFQPASTYPRLIYSTTEDSLITSNSLDDTTLSRVEGIYILAVEDSYNKGSISNKDAGFYDFYIRTCWYGTGTDTPSIISTVIRLYNPPQE